MIVRKRLIQLQVQLSNKIKGINNALIINDQYRTSWQLGGGLIPGQMIGVTGDTGGGKTKYVKFLILSVYLAFKKDKNPNFKVVWFGLEETEEEFIDSIICTLYYIYYKESLDYSVLNSYRADTMTKEIWERILKIENIAQDFCNHITHVDCDKPEEMFHFCREFVQKEGDASFTSTIIDSREEFVYKRLSNTFYVAVVDHTSLVKQGSGKYDTKHDAIERWVVDYAKKIISKKWRWNIINIMQQGFDSNKSSIYNQKGEINPRRVEPTMEKLGNNKEIARDHYIMIGLFKPYAFQISTYPKDGYDITLLEDNYTCAIFMKNRFGQGMNRVHYWFDGNSFIYNELPSFKSQKTELELFYNKINEQKNGNSNQDSPDNPF